MARAIEQIFRVDMIPQIHGQRVRGGFVGKRDVLSRSSQYFAFRKGMNLEKAGIALAAKENAITLDELQLIGFTNRGVKRNVLRAKIEDRSNVEINNIIDRIALRASDERTADNILCAVLWRTGHESNVLMPYNPEIPLASLKDRPKEFYDLAISIFDNAPQIKHIFSEKLRSIRGQEANHLMGLAIENRKVIRLNSVDLYPIPEADIRNDLAASYLCGVLYDAYKDEPEAQGTFMVQVLQYANSQYADFKLPRQVDINKGISYPLFSGNPMEHFLMVAAENLYGEEELSKKKELFIQAGKAEIEATK